MFGEKVSPFIPTNINVYGVTGMAASLIPTFTFLRDFVELVPSGTFTFKGSHSVETVSSLTNTRDGLALVHICTRKEDNHSQPSTQNFMQSTKRGGKGAGGKEWNVSCRLQVAIKANMSPKTEEAQRREGHRKNGRFKLKTEFQSRFDTIHSTFAVTFNAMQKNMLKDPGSPDKGATRSSPTVLQFWLGLCLPCRGPNVVGSGADCRRAVLPEMSSPTWHRHWPVLLTLTVPPQRVTLGIPYTCGRHCHPPQFNPIRTNPLQSRWWIEWLEWWKERVAIVHGGRRE